MNDNYEKEIKKAKDKYDELNFELTKKNAEVKEQTELKEATENKLKEKSKQITELNEISKSKDSLINTQNDNIKMYQDKVNDYKKTKEDLELSLARNIYNFKMKETGPLCGNRFFVPYDADLMKKLLFKPKRSFPGKCIYRITAITSFSVPAACGGMIFPSIFSPFRVISTAPLSR